MPNPTLLTSWQPLVVFTAWYLQDFSSYEVIPQGAVNSHRKCWYPSIFFYCLREQKVIWEIYGAEAYLGSSPTKEVYYISNEIWSSITEDEMK